MKKNTIASIVCLTILLASFSFYSILEKKSDTQRSAVVLNNIVTKHIVSSNVFKLQIPAKWKTTIESNENIYFGKNQKDDIGGAIIKRLKFLEGEHVITENIIRRMLPNHLDINYTKNLNGFFTEAYLLNVTMNASAQQGGYFIGNWNYIVFIDRKKSTDKQVIAYALYLNTKDVTEQEAITIARTLKVQ